MRLYSLVDADSHVDPVHGRFTPDEAGGFDFPDEVAETLATFAVKGRKLWETEGARVDRLHGMEMARRRDPASMLTAMEDNAALTRKITELMAQLAAAQLGQAPAPASDPAAPAVVAEPAPAPAKSGRAPKSAAARPAASAS